MLSMQSDLRAVLSFLCTFAAFLSLSHGAVITSRTDCVLCSFDDPGSWQGGVVPTAADTAIIHPPVSSGCGLTFQIEGVHVVGGLEIRPANTLCTAGASSFLGTVRINGTLTVSGNATILGSTPVLSRTPNVMVFVEVDSALEAQFVLVNQGAGLVGLGTVTASLSITISDRATLQAGFSIHLCNSCIGAVGTQTRPGDLAVVTPLLTVENEGRVAVVGNSSQIIMAAANDALNLTNAVIQLLGDGSLILGDLNTEPITGIGQIFAFSFEAKNVKFPLYFHSCDCPGCGNICLAGDDPSNEDDGLCSISGGAQAGSLLVSFTPSSSPSCSNSAYSGEGASFGATCASTTLICVNGACVDTAVGPACQCPPLQNGFGWTGTQCDVPLCPSDCGGSIRGACISSPNVFCNCSAQWSGSTCSSPVCSPACVNGTCLATLPPRCSCFDGYQGDACDVPLVDGVCPLTCGVGQCVNTSCSCPSFGYSGSFCEVFSCASDCNGNGNCVPNALAPPSCSCTAAWVGDASCGTRVCLANDCLNGGICSVSSGTKVDCACLPEWSGSRCQIPRNNTGTGDSEPSTNSKTLTIVLAVVIPIVVLAGAAIALAIVFYHKKTSAKYTKTQNEAIKNKNLHAMRNVASV